MFHSPSSIKFTELRYFTPFTLRVSCPSNIDCSYFLPEISMSSQGLKTNKSIHAGSEQQQRSRHHLQTSLTNSLTRSLSPICHINVHLCSSPLERCTPFLSRPQSSFGQIDGTVKRRWSVGKVWLRTSERPMRCWMTEAWQASRQVGGEAAGRPHLPRTPSRTKWRKFTGHLRVSQSVLAGVRQ